MQQRHYLREWRLAKGLTQEQVAAALDIHQGQLSKLERNDRPYTQRLLEKAAVLFECTPGEIIIRNPLSREGIWTVWDKLDETGKSQLVEIGQTLYKNKKAG